MPMIEGNTKETIAVDSGYGMPRMQTDLVFVLAQIEIEKLNMQIFNVQGIVAKERQSK